MTGAPLVFIDKGAPIDKIAEQLGRIATAMEAQSVPVQAEKRIKELEAQLIGAHLSFASQLERILDESAYTMNDRARELRTLAKWLRQTAQEYSE